MMTYVYITISLLLGIITIYLGIRYLQLMYLLKRSKLMIPENFFKILKFETECLSSIPKHISLINSSIQQIDIPSIPPYSPDSDEYQKARDTINEYFTQENLESGISSISLNSVPYFSRMHKGYDVSALAGYIGKEIPKLGPILSAVTKSTKNEESYHKRFF